MALGKAHLEAGVLSAHSGPHKSAAPRAQVGVREGVVLLTYSSLISAADSGACACC